ncbi:MAG: B12-binding domain-containing radical SAM protein [Candidatus Omnitrophica bacterium]|nr:B12-binding domain-containing radical SAM protein [Candidatus Omnitrophota bacterium]
MMRVAFVCPGYENLGIEYLSAVLRQDGVETRLFLDPILFAESNFIDHPGLAGLSSYKARLLREIRRFDPQLICFSVISDNYRWACQWAADLRAVAQGRIVFGGIHPTSSPEVVIRSSCVDYICIGEGEYPLRDLVRSLASGGDGSGILNIWSKKDDEVLRTGIRPPIEDLDALPFPDKGLFYHAHPVFKGGYLAMTSRGCSFSCKYCCNNVYHRLYGKSAARIRRRSVGHVIAELERAKKEYAPRHILFADDLFNSDVKWLQAFLQEYRQRIGLPFACYVFPDLIDEPVAQALQDAGCFKVQMGLQVFDQEKRKNVLGRVSSQDKIAAAIGSLRRRHIYVVCDTIFGFPDEVEEELVGLARFYAEHPPDHCESFWLRYYPGTEITQWAFENGYIDQSKKRRIEEGLESFGMVKNPEHPGTGSYARQIMLLLSLYPFMPKKLKLWVLDRKIYRHMPLLPSIVVYVLVRLVHHPRFDFNTERTWRRYRYFLTRLIFQR